MCDRQITNSFEKQTSSEKISFSPYPTSLGFTGPTIKVNAVIQSRPITKTELQGASMSVTGPLGCRNTEIPKLLSLNFNGTFNTSKLKTGPYSNTGGQINFREIFFNFFDLEIEFDGTYKLEQDLVCQETIPQTYNIDNKPFNVSKIKSIKFDKERYFATNTSDDSNINELQFDLVPLFLDASSSFGKFFEQQINGLLNETGFGRKVEKEIDRIYCLDKNKSEEISINYYTAYKYKIKRLEEIGIVFRDKIS
jgi:hypothetical protein